jgi:hypothetical protein
VPPAATASKPAAPAPRPALDTTVVSAEGRAVLATIPEPLPPAERVPAPTRESLAAPRPGGVTLPAPAASYDTLRASVPAGEAAATTTAPTASDTGATAAARDTAAAAAPDSSAANSGGAAVPVPEPTQPLGDRPGTLERMLAPDTSAAPPPTAPPATPAAPAKAVPDTCWRVQVAAPADHAKAERLRAAAESQLLVPFVVEREKGLYKVRSKGCIDSAASESLRRRASLAGFSGVFRSVGGKR